MPSMIPYGNLQKMVSLSLTLSPASVAANTVAEQTFTCPGVRVGDVVLAVNKPTTQAGLGIVNARVSATDQVAIAFSNNTGSPIVPTASQVYAVTIGRLDSSAAYFS